MTMLILLARQYLRVQLLSGGSKISTVKLHRAAISEINFNTLKKNLKEGDP